MRGHVAYRRTQAIWRQARKIKEAVRPPLVRQHPAEGGKCQCRGILYGIFTCVNNCQQPVMNIDVGSPSIGKEGFGG